ncbi:MAG: RHS repeat-associated core domain-containing protein, partial [Planctomycetes bacterium]|nr:RHS repeat-associated core domain-containing protein [Planctomycetota bacterium]
DTYRRDAGFSLQTQYRFTGQRLEQRLGAPEGGLDRGLYFYGARWYDSTIGRFIQADTIVPSPGDPQSLNRYSYVGNRPTIYRDPTGHAPQDPNDSDDNPAPCATDWCWQNRWYRAHSYSWNGSGWSLMGAIARFYDINILTETIGEAGISFAGSWDFVTQMTPIAQGIVKFGMMLSGGMAHLQGLLGGGAPIRHGSCLGSACAPPYLGNVYLPGSTDSTWLMQTVVHELAHLIDWHSRIQSGSIRAYGASASVYSKFSDMWGEPPLTDYAAGKTGGFRPYPLSWDRWAEAVTVWVFGNSYKSSERPLNVDVGAQMTRIGDLLNGWR